MSILNNKIKYKLFFLLFIFLNSYSESFSQDNGYGNYITDEFLRRMTLKKANEHLGGFVIRDFSNLSQTLFYSDDSLKELKSEFEFNVLPIFLTAQVDGKRPYLRGEFGMIPARGIQSFLRTGVKARFSILNILFQPEFLSVENLPFIGFPNNFSVGATQARYLDWNFADSPERFGNATFNQFFWGQSSISLRYGAFELGAGTKNFWWGPGQWNSLIFSNNAPGFPNVSLNTTKPVKTLIGHFESQLIIGKLPSFDYEPSQNYSLNDLYYSPKNRDSRYLNGIVFSYTNKWLPSLTAGFIRTFQYYNSERPKNLSGWLPIIEPLAKEKFFTNGNSGKYDSKNQSQQLSIFSRYVFKERGAEVYFEFGRRDHAFNWREFFLNPEHARAYQFGFIKINQIPNSVKFLQIRGEITHQQESINRILRYDLFGGQPWYSHSPIRSGFTNYGQSMGVGIGTGSNVQTLEVSVVDNWKKLGILFERLENNQDFYYRGFGQQGERKPWIDWSTALLWNTSYKDLFISARLQGTYAWNYQWGLSEASTPEFPVSKNLFSMHSQINLIYFWNRSLKNEKVD
jgi:hypothetical protein